MENYYSNLHFSVAGLLIIAFTILIQVLNGA